MERAVLQIGEKHLLSVTAVNGVWLHYEISSAKGETIKPSDSESFIIDKLLNQRLKFVKDK